MAKGKKNGNMIGGWAFVIGVILAVIFGFLGDLTPGMLWILVVIGLIVGLLNIADEEAMPFMMSGVVLIIAGSLGGGALGVVSILDSMLNALMAIFVPATIIVALKNVFGFARR